MIALDPRQGADQLWVADHKTNTPASHVVTLGQGEELHRDVFGTWHLHDRRRLPTVVNDVGVGQIVDDQHIVLLGQCHNTLEEIQLDALRRRVRGEAKNHHLRLGDRLADRPLKLVEEVHTRHQRHRTHLGTGNHGTVDMNRITGVGYQHGVAMIQGGKHQVSQAFLGTNGNDGFAFRVDLDLVAVFVPPRNRPAQARNATGCRVAMSVFTLGDLHQFFDDVRWRCPVGVAHAQVDDVLATTACGHLEFGGDVEDVRGETINARKAARRTLVSHGFLEDVSARNRPSDVGHCGGRCQQ
ncbi:hypothetical protein D3C78_774180 [compost metagenome]